MTPLRVGVVCDFAEERWPSMDLIADMLLAALPEAAGGAVVASRLQPPMPRRWTRLPLSSRTSRALLADRLTGRFWDYPRWLAPRASQFDLFHIVDHSYAHLAAVLPPNRTVVTCHDVDAVRAALPRSRRRADPERLLATRILAGLRRAAHVACVSQATRAELVEASGLDGGRVSVVYEGVHPSCTPAPHAGEGREVLHVGSTIPRKRLDVLLDVFAGLRRLAPDLRLVRVGGPFTAGQRVQADRLGVRDAIVEMPPLDRDRLADLYRRATLVLLPSDREGFGLPVVEAMACGTPVVASAIPALQEIGADAATYCPPGDVAAWIATVAGLLNEKTADPRAWEARREACLRNAARFDWRRYAGAMAELYQEVARR